MFQHKIFLKSYKNVISKNKYDSENIKTSGDMFKKYEKRQCELKINSKNLESGRVVYTTNDFETEVYLNFIKDFLTTKLNYSPASRNQSIQLILNNLTVKNFKFDIVKLDLKDFYNSIDHSKIKEMINNHPKIYETEFKSILEVYFSSASSGKSVFPGLSPSNILAEMYGKEVDKIINNVIDEKKLNLYLYTRYVDDILIFIEPGRKEIVSFVKEIGSKIFDELDLKMNEEKSKLIDEEFEYLGYKFVSENNVWKIDISDAKTDKILSQIEMLQNWYMNSELDIPKRNQVFWEKYNYFRKTKVFRKKGSFFLTGIPENYKFLDNSFEIEVYGSKESNIISNVRKINSKLENMELNITECTKQFDESLFPFFLVPVKTQEKLKPKIRNNFDLKTIIESNQKLIFIDNKENFNKKQIKHKLVLHFGYIKTDLYNKNYNDLCDIYINEIKKGS